MSTTLLSSLFDALKTCMICDRHNIQKKLDQARVLSTKNPNSSRFEELTSEINRITLNSKNLAKTRLDRIPNIDFDDTLPVVIKRSIIEEAISTHQVVIICGETGSGKTTQLPKMALSLGRGVYGKIAHTQPRRLAARAVASRIAKELRSEIGKEVGYKVRFNAHTSPDTYIELMTDGILLAETQHDRFLTQYDTIIIDEAHERSLNIDFLLGYLKIILPKRPDLKIIVTSATIDAERFSRHFGKAPIIEVSGRTYPVDILYRPLYNDDEEKREMEMEEAIVSAAEELWRRAPGDILVFLPGEREIRETTEQLNKYFNHEIEILPLLARLTYEEQQRVFRPSFGRRIILATNVAETSLTVPGVSYVIDTGLVRLKRYSPRAKIEQLFVEKTSQASARQRAGRCGRVSAGICIRLYDEADFNTRPLFTDPEILRTSLATVILRMHMLNLMQIEHFPFLDAPSSRQVSDGHQTLYELGAIDKQRKLTEIGKHLAKLPLDPRIGRILLAAKDQHCLTEILAIAAVLSIADPRMRPLNAREKADQAHAKFNDEKSDFLTYLHIWQFFEKAMLDKPSKKQLMHLCQDNFIAYLRLIEWRELHRQLRDIVQKLHWRVNTIEAPHSAIHQTLLTGFLTQVGMKQPEQDQYLGTREVKFHIFPGSGLKKRRPKWVMTALYMETSRVYAHCVAEIDVSWLESIAAHLTKHHYDHIHWEEKTAQVVALERITLFGLPIITQRKKAYGLINPAEARELFIREALVNRRFHTKAQFFEHNHQLVKEVEELEHKSRRLDVLIDDAVLVTFYDEHLPQTIVDGVSFEDWLKHASSSEQEQLLLDKAFLMQHTADTITEEQFPEYCEVNGIRLPFSYRFEPGHPLDGVTVRLPLALLNSVDGGRLEWLVPGLLREKLTHLIKNLPKVIRKYCVPVPAFVTQALTHFDKADRALALLPQLAQWITQTIAFKVTQEDFNVDTLPSHLTMHINVVDDQHHILASGRNVILLQQQLGKTAEAVLKASTTHPFERDQIYTWNFGDLPAEISLKTGLSYPALIVDENACLLRLLNDKNTAEKHTRKGIIWLLQKDLETAINQISKPTATFTQIALKLRSLLNAETLIEDLTTAICNRALLGDDPIPRTEKAYQIQKARAKTRLKAVQESFYQILQKITDQYHPLSLLLNQNHPLQKTLIYQINHLIYKGFLEKTSYEQLKNFPRYFEAMSLRISKYTQNPSRDIQYEKEIMMLWGKYEEKYHDWQADSKDTSSLMAFRWGIEELRVSLFAQALRTPVPVSVKRLEKIWSDIIEDRWA